MELFRVKECRDNLLISLSNEKETKHLHCSLDYFQEMTFAVTRSHKESIIPYFNGKYSILTHMDTYRSQAYFGAKPRQAYFEAGCSERLLMS